jgi:hypothetical protein
LQDRKIVLLVAIALAASSCVDMGQMPGQTGASKVGDALSPPTFYQGGSYDSYQNNVVTQGGDKATQITVRAMIAPNGENSWTRSAPWNEIVLTVQNQTHREIEVVSISGVTAQGTTIAQGGMDSFTTIEQQRATTLQNQFAQQAQSPQTADLGSMMTTAFTNALTGGTAPVGAAPAAAAGAAAPQNAQQAAQKAALDQQAADFQSVSAEYTKRALDQAKLPARSSITGSAFFPASAGEITEVVVSVRESRRSENVKDLAIALPNKHGAPAETASGGVKVSQ